MDDAWRHYHCQICDEAYAVDEIENHVIEEHPEEVFPEFDVRDLPFVLDLKGAT